MLNRHTSVTALSLASALVLCPPVFAQDSSKAPVIAIEGVSAVADSSTLRFDRSLSEPATAAFGPASRFVTEPIRLPGDRWVQFELERFAIADNDTPFVIGRRNGPDARIPYDVNELMFLRGTAVDHAGSNVFLSVRRDRVTGTIDLGPTASSDRYLGVASAGVEQPEDELHASVFRALAPAETLPVGVCGCEEIASTEPESPGSGTHRNGPSVPVGTRQIEIAIETDYELFELFGNMNAVFSYVLEVYAANSNIFLRDVDVTLKVSFVRVWDDPDDLFNSPAPLPEMRAFWNKNMQDVPRDIAQLFSGRSNLPYGGVAYLGTVCGGSGYSVSAYSLGFFPTMDRPTVFGRDVLITSHEIGHNLGTPHTHDLGLDTCNDEESEPQRGSIMSYCGQTFTGGSANTDPRFHTVVRDTIHNVLANRDCLDADCNLNGIADADDIDSGESADENSNGIPDECEDCDGDGTLDDEEIAEGAADINGNGIPDSCEPDCNQTGTPDSYDIEMGFSDDRFGNGIPDECEADCNDNEQSDFSDIQEDMSLDLDRNAILDDCQDCDGNGTPDLEYLEGAHNVWVATLEQPIARQYLWLTGTEVNQTDDAGIQEAQDVVITPDRRVLVTSKLDHRIVEFDRFGAWLGDFVSGDPMLIEPTGMALTDHNTLLVSSSGGDAVIEYDLADGSNIGPFVLPSTGLEAPFGLAFGPDGNLYVTSGDQSVLRFDGDTGQFISAVVSDFGGSPILGPRNMAFVPGGNLLVVSHDTNQILRFDVETNTFLGQFNNGGTADRLSLDQPWDIELGPDGNVYVTRAHDHPDPEDPGGPFLHLTNARVYIFNAESGRLQRALIQGVNSNLEHATGFAFMPDPGFDCNLNLIPDQCDLEEPNADLNDNGVLDACEGGCVADIDGDGVLTSGDFFVFLMSFNAADFDFNEDGITNAQDFFAYLDAFNVGCD